MVISGPLVCTLGAISLHSRPLAHWYCTIQRFESSPEMTMQSSDHWGVQVAEETAEFEAHCVLRTLVTFGGGGVMAAMRSAS